MAVTYEPIVATASLTLDDKHLGAVVRLEAAAGLTVTLPASTGKGKKFMIEVGTTVTSNDYIIQVANATDVMEGAVGVTTDAAGVVIPTASTSDTITMNGSTTGGLAGSCIVLVDVAAGKWAVSGALVSTGTEATPFSAAVS